MNYAKEAAEYGNPNSITDAGVAAVMANAAAHGAALNVKINLNEIDDIQYCENMVKQTDLLLKKMDKMLSAVRKIVLGKLNSD